MVGTAPLYLYCNLVAGKVKVGLDMVDVRINHD
jgi:hypothetical protein